MNALSVIADLNAAFKHTVDVKDRRRATEVYLAELMSYHCDLPSGIVSDPEAYFRTHIKVNVVQELAKVNEHIILDIDACCGLVYKLWKARYQLVFRPDLPSTPRLFDVAVSAGMVDKPHADVRQCYGDRIAPRRIELKGEQE